MLEELRELERKERELQQRKRDIESSLGQLVTKEQQLAKSRRLRHRCGDGAS